MDFDVRSWWKTTNSYFLQGAIARDKFANFNYRRSMNVFLSKNLENKEVYKFGNVDETLSSVLGKKQLEKSLSLFGWVIVFLLWIIDIKHWFDGGHCVNSIMD